MMKMVCIKAVLLSSESTTVMFGKWETMKRCWRNFKLLWKKHKLMILKIFKTWKNRNLTTKRLCWKRKWVWMMRFLRLMSKWHQKNCRRSMRSRTTEMLKVHWKNIQNFWRLWRMNSTENCTRFVQLRITDRYLYSSATSILQNSSLIPDAPFFEFLLFFFSFFFRLLITFRR